LQSRRDHLRQGIKEWLKFSLCFWHTFVGGGGQDPFGSQTLMRESWEGDLQGMALASMRRVDVAFEYFTKLGVDYYCFHDFDVAPEGDTLDESMANVDVIADYLLETQKETGY
jgi:xylose isomerase